MVPHTVPGRFRGRAHLAVLGALIAVTFVASLAVQHDVFPLYSGDKDEPVYVMQAQALRDGHVTLPARDFGDGLQPWLTGRRGDRIFFAFPPGWPAALALSDLLVGSMRVGVALVAAALVVAAYLFALELTRRRRVALVTAALLSLSPFAILQSGLVLSYLFTLMLGLFFGYGVLRGMRTRSRRHLLLAGAALGMIFCTRPFDAGLWALPFGLYLAYEHRNRLRSLWRPTAWVAAASTPFAALMLVYNTHVTGNALVFPITAAEPLNKMGFGPRRISPSAHPIDWTLLRALRATAHNLVALPPWALGGMFGVTLAIIGLLLRRRDHITGLLLGIGATFSVGYLSYWGVALMATGSEAIGPQYHLPLLVPIAVLGAYALLGLWNRRRGAAVLIASAMVALSVTTMLHKFDAQRDLTSAYRRWQKPVRHLPNTRRLVFVPHGDDPYLLTDLPFLSNKPGDDDRQVLYAVDKGAHNIAVMKDRPDRVPYVLTPELQKGDDLFHPTIELKRLTIQRGRSVTLQLHVTNPGSQPVVEAYVYTHRGFVSQYLDLASEMGREYDVEWTIGPSGIDQFGVISMPDAMGAVSVGVGFGNSPFLDRRSDLYERRYIYNGEGWGDHQVLQIATPGLEWHRWTFRTPTWVAQDVDDVLEQRDLAPS